MADDVTPKETDSVQKAENAELAEDLQQLLESMESVSPNDLFGNTGFVAPSGDGSSIENPKLAYDLYHGTIEAILRKHIPKTTSKIEGERKIAKEIRKLKNMYLNDGKKRGVDGKMVFNHRKLAVANEIVAWLNEYGGGNYSALHGRLAKLCAEAGLKV